MLRILIVCLLALGVPLKGALATSMVMCGTGHDQPGTVAVSQAAGVDAREARHHHRDHASHQHANAFDAEAIGGADSANQGEVGKHGAVKCSICAVCCVGGACLVSADVSMPASVGTDSPFPALTVRFPGTVLAGLERPPRSFLV